MRHIISLLMENEAGALSRVIGLFSQRGYNGATMREIARLCDLTEAAIYKHFAGKEKLYEEVILGKSREHAIGAYLETQRFRTRDQRLDPDKLPHRPLERERRAPRRAPDEFSEMRTPVTSQPKALQNISTVPPAG